MKEPKMYIENEEEANTLLKEWQERLFLQHWNISFYVADSLSNEDAGQSIVQWVNSCGTITLLSEKTLKEKGGFIEKVCHEQILIHELLHFKYMWLNGSSLESTVYAEKQHQLLEQMAKSLYMAKYDLSYDWFKGQEG